MKTKTTLAVLALTLVTSTSAFAQHNGRPHGGHNVQRANNTYVQKNVQHNVNRGGYNSNRGYNNYNRGGNWGNGWGYAGAAVAGALIGGAIANSYAQPAPVYVQPYVQPYINEYAAPPYYAPVQPRWHWEQRWDAGCNCMRNIQNGLMAHILTFSLLCFVPILVGYVAYRMVSHDHKSWEEHIKRMGDDRW